MLSTTEISFTAPSTINYTGTKPLAAFVGGENIYVRGASNAANNAQFTISSVTATTIVVTQTTIVTEAVTGREIRVFNVAVTGYGVQIRGDSTGNIVTDNQFVETDSVTNFAFGSYLGDSTTTNTIYAGNNCVGLSNADLQANASATYRAYNNHSLSSTAANQAPDDLQSIAYAASITPNSRLGSHVLVGALTGNITINAPTNPVNQRRMTYSFVQDATGTRTITLNAVFRGITGNVIAAGTASQKLAVSFIYDGAAWLLDGGTPVWG